VGIDGGGGAGNRINSLIEAQRRARELGSPADPDAAEEQTERTAQRATWVIGGLAVTGGTWLVAGPGAAAVMFAALALCVLAVWWIAAWLRGREGNSPQDVPRQRE
jgi:hypothetical protein